MLFLFPMSKSDAATPLASMLYSACVQCMSRDAVSILLHVGIWPHVWLQMMLQV